MGVEGEGAPAPGVHGHGGGIVREAPALCPQEGSIRRVQQRVGVAFPSEVVEPVAEEVTVSDSNGVSPCIYIYSPLFLYIACIDYS